MAKLPVVAGAELVKALQKQGFVVLRQHGSHIVMQKRDASGVITTVVPAHKEVARGTLHAILRKARLSPDDLIRLLTIILGITPLLK